MTLDLFSKLYIQQAPLVAIVGVIGWLVGAVVASILFIYAVFVAQLVRQTSRSVGQLLEGYNEAIRQCIQDLEQDDDAARELDQALVSALIREEAQHVR